MHDEILTERQIKLLPVVKQFRENFGLVGGTAIALHVGHRQSIDFDLFTMKDINYAKIRSTIKKFAKIDEVIFDEKNEYSAVIGGIRMTFLRYDFEISFSEKYQDIAMLPDLLTLAAMKAYALGRRAKWKDYVDLYFVMKDYFPIGDIIKKAEEIFKMEFNSKSFRTQLAYFQDVDYSEKVIYLKDFEVDDDIVKKELVKFSLEK